LQKQFDPSSKEGRRLLGDSFLRIHTENEKVLLGSIPNPSIYRFFCKQYIENRIEIFDRRIKLTKVFFIHYISRKGW